MVTQLCFLTVWGSLGVTFVISKQDKIVEYCNSEKQSKLLMATIRWSE